MSNVSPLPDVADGNSSDPNTYVFAWGAKRWTETADQIILNDKHWTLGIIREIVNV